MAASAFFWAAVRWASLIFWRLPKSIAPCQPVTSLPLKRAVKPAGGVLSSARQSGVRMKIRPAKASSLYMDVLLRVGNTSRVGQECSTYRERRSDVVVRRADYRCDVPGERGEMQGKR